MIISTVAQHLLTALHTLHHRVSPRITSTLDRTDMAANGSVRRKQQEFPCKLSAISLTLASRFNVR
jgi:hypothetical protein